MSLYIFKENLEKAFDSKYIINRLFLLTWRIKIITGKLDPMIFFLKLPFKIIDALGLYFRSRLRPIYGFLVPPPLKVNL